MALLSEHNNFIIYYSRQKFNTLKKTKIDNKKGNIYGNKNVDIIDDECYSESIVA